MYIPLVGHGPKGRHPGTTWAEGPTPRCRWMINNSKTTLCVPTAFSPSHELSFLSDTHVPPCHDAKHYHSWYSPVCLSIQPSSCYNICYNFQLLQHLLQSSSCYNICYNPPAVTTSSTCLPSHEMPKECLLPFLMQTACSFLSRLLSTNFHCRFYLFVVFSSFFYQRFYYLSMVLSKFFYQKIFYLSMVLSTFFYQQIFYLSVVLSSFFLSVTEKLA